MQDFSYQTPIPQATIAAYEYGQPIKTKMQAVIAARKFAFSFHMHWVGDPKVLFVEKMEYQEAKRRIEPNATPYFDPTPQDSQVWLLVFEGQYTITAPGGEIIGPHTGCGYTIFFADTGEAKSEGGRPCEDYKLDQ